MGEIYSYKLLSIDDIPQLEKLFLAAFNQQVKKDFFKWKYFDNPFGSAILVGAYFNDLLVGSGAMIPEELNHCGKINLTYKCTDLMTHPYHQQKGISKSVNAFLNEEVLKTKASYTYTLCSKVSTKSFVKNKWVHVEEISNFFKPRILLRSSFLFANRKSGIHHFDELGNILDNFRFFVSDNLISLNKTNAFMKWRISNPNFSYKILCHFDEKEEVNGYLIYSLSSNNLVNIIDFESTDKLIVKNLLKELEYLAVKGRFRGILVMTLKKSRLYRFIGRRGYIRNPFNKGPLKTILDFNMKVNDSDESLFDSRIWEISSLNYDDI